MASDYRRFVGYSLEELEELFPYYYEDSRLSIVTFRPNEIKTIFVSKNDHCRYIGVEYWDGEIVITDGKTVESSTLSELYDKLS